MATRPPELLKIDRSATQRKQADDSASGAVKSCTTVSAPQGVESGENRIIISSSQDADDYLLTWSPDTSREG